MNPEHHNLDYFLDHYLSEAAGREFRSRSFSLTPGEKAHILPIDNQDYILHVPIGAYAEYISGDDGGFCGQSYPHGLHPQALDIGQPQKYLLSGFHQVCVRGNDFMIVACHKVPEDEDSFFSSMREKPEPYLLSSEETLRKRFHINRQKKEMERERRFEADIRRTEDAIIEHGYVLTHDEALCRVFRKAGCVIMRAKRDKHLKGNDDESRTVIAAEGLEITFPGSGYYTDGTRGYRHVIALGGETVKISWP